MTGKRRLPGRPGGAARLAAAVGITCLLATTAAVASVVQTAPGGSGATFAQLDAEFGVAIDAERAAFADATGSTASALTGLVAGPAGADRPRPRPSEDKRRETRQPNIGSCKGSTQPADAGRNLIRSDAGTR